MANFISMEKISLKNNPDVKEEAIQAYIFENPHVLGLGDLTPIRREKVQPYGGRLDILLADDETRYEVEIQLGATDPSHIIRTIEYWDLERKRYPAYDHCAVIVAEEITSRFMNVISLFNGSIPLIALQLVATKVGEDINLSFVKVLDRMSQGTDEENEIEPTDRNYWEKKSNKLGIVDNIYKDISEFASGFELKYNKYYIGVAQNGVASNFIDFRPKQKYIYLSIKVPEDSNFNTQLDSTALEYDYMKRDRAYRIKISKYTEYEKHKEILHPMIQAAMENKNIDF